MTDMFDQNKDVTPTLFDQMVGEGKKFDNAEALAKGKTDSDEYITKLQTEMSELRVDLNKRLGAEEVLNQLKTSAPATPADIPTAAFSQEDVEALVSKKMESLTAGNKAINNLNEVAAMMNAKYGEKSSDILNAKAAELGVSTDYLKQTAEASPSAFASILGLGAAQGSPVSAPASTINTEALGAGTPDLKAGYDKLRRENPKEYFSPRVQNEYMRLVSEGKIILT